MLCNTAVVTAAGADPDDSGVARKLQMNPEGDRSSWRLPNALLRPSGEGGLASGHGTIRPNSGAFHELPVTWAARTEAPDGKTSPEELAAAAHSSCFAMALSLCLGERERRDREAHGVVHGHPGRGGRQTHHRVVRTRGPRAGSPAWIADGFQSAVDEAAALCPISRLFAGATISVSSDLEPV